MSAPANGTRVRSRHSGREGRVLNRAGPDAVQVEWDEGGRGVVPAAALETIDDDDRGEG